MQHRKKIRLPQQAYKQGHAFSITLTAANRYPWFELYPDLTKKFIHLFVAEAKQRQTKLFAWCIMPNHAHFLLQDDNIIDFVRAIKGKLVPVARRTESGRSLWQRSFYDHALRSEEALESVARYIWNNPVRAGTMEIASAYPWSGSLVWPDWTEYPG